MRLIYRQLPRVAVESYYRLFMVPGMLHCGGGPGPNEFDAETALESWVEQRRRRTRSSRRR